MDRGFAYLYNKSKPNGYTFSNGRWANRAAVYVNIVSLTMKTRVLGVHVLIVPYLKSLSVTNMKIFSVVKIRNRQQHVVNHKPTIN